VKNLMSSKGILRIVKALSYLSVAAVLTHCGVTDGPSLIFGGPPVAPVIGGAPPELPPPPTGVVATAAVDSIVVTWLNAEGATSYNLYCTTDMVIDVRTTPKISNATSPYTLTGLVAGTPVNCLVTSSRDELEGSPSVPTSTIPF